MFTSSEVFLCVFDNTSQITYGDGGFLVVKAEAGSSLVGGATAR